MEIKECWYSDDKRLTFLKPETTLLDDSMCCNREQGDLVLRETQHQQGDTFVVGTPDHFDVHLEKCEHL